MKKKSALSLRQILFLAAVLLAFGGTVGIAVLPSQPVQTLPEGLGIAVIEEARIAVMRATDAPRMLDRAPVLLGACGDFAGVGRHAVRSS